MDKTDEILTRRVEKVLPNKKTLKALMQKQKIKLYQGFDPTGGRLHLGHSIGIRKLMEFANAGHEVIFLFGTGTVLVGDPSQRDSGRPLITEKEIEANIKTWKEQVSPLVNFEKVKIMENGEWLTNMSLKDFILIASKISAVQLFKREMFQKRLDRGDTIWYHETMYPLLQGYDSVAMNVDLEIGGTDQEFNMLIGRELQSKINSKEKFVLTMPMILGTDGKQMSKTTGNCVWLDDKPNDMFGKLMSIPDKQIISYMELATNTPTDKIGETEKNLKSGKINPINAKKELAYTVVEELHSLDDAKSARAYFEKTFQESQPEYKTEWTFSGNATITDMVSDIVGSKSEAKRLISQKAVDIGGITVLDPNIALEGGEKIKIGKKEFRKVIKK